MGRLIGRRAEVREIVRELTRGTSAGCQILGMGGVGKSSVAGRVIERLAPSHAIVEVSGPVSADTLGKEASRVVEGFTLSDDPVRSLEDLLRSQRVLLVLDNFEDNLDGHHQFRDPATQALMRSLCEAAGKGRLLITSRYPVPEAEDWLRVHRLGPLTGAQLRKLLLRHPRLQAMEPEARQTVARTIGGHPRAIEYLDAILNQGRAELPRVTGRLQDLARRHGLETRARDLSAAVDQTVAAAAADVLLDTLLELVGPEARAFLDRVSVYPVPVVEKNDAVERLADLSLLAAGPQGVLVHRWTAEALRTRMEPGFHRQACVEAGRRLLVERDWLNAVRLLLQGQKWEEAVPLAWAIAGVQRRNNQTSAAAAFCREVSDALPESSADRFRFRHEEVDCLRGLGLIEQAFAAVTAARDGLQRLVDQEPDRADYLRDLSVSFNKLGDLMRALGQGAEARRYYEQDLAISQRLVDQEPDRADYLRDLSVSFERLGDLMSALGQGAEARRYYEQALAISQRLVDQEPDRADYLRDLSVSFNKLGDLMSALGQGAEARRYYEQALAIRQRLVDQEPDRADYLRDLSV
ncbi:MAG: tetratricopeptide repeat protein, partial [Acidobacteria bacterium]|nr:tetratricopeptide repeat protein [Acidobacteriota bacterium]